MRPAKIVAIVFGALLGLVGLALFVPGIVLLGAYGALKDDAGFLQTSTRVVSSNGYAVLSPNLDLNIGSNGWEWVPTGGKLAFRVVASATDSRDLFVGIGPSDEVAAYLNGVEYDEIADYGWRSSSVGYRHLDGGAPPTRPADQTFWVASQEGSGTQDLQWDIADGDWTAVVMNGDGSAPVTVNLSLGARFGILLPIGIAVTVFGFILLAVGILLIVLGARRSRAVPTAPPVGGWGPASGGWVPPSGGGGWQSQPGHPGPQEGTWQPEEQGGSQPASPLPPGGAGQTESGAAREPGEPDKTNWR